MRIRLPLWIHQLVEYLLAVLLVTQSVNAGKAATLMAVAGGLLFVLAATTDASMGAVRWIPPRVHRLLDVAVIGALVAAPIVAGSTDPIAWALCLLGAAAIAWLNWHTQWSRAPRRVATSTAGPESDASAESVPPPAPSLPPVSAPSPSKPATLGESARNLGKTVDRTTRGASRAAGRIYGRAKAQRSDPGTPSDPSRPSDPANPSDTTT